MVARTVLIVAFDFPPAQRSSGIHRILSMCRHLPEHGWTPVVITARPSAYEHVQQGNTELLPDGLAVERAIAFDAMRDFSVRGKYPDLLAVPDRWQSWIPFAVAKALSAARRRGCDAVISSYPILSSHVIGRVVGRVLRRPWVADFRDPVMASGAAFGRRERRVRQWVERTARDHAAALVATTEAAAAAWQASGACQPVVTIRNGYDDDQLNPDRRPPESCTPVRVAHTGALYGESRNPRPLLEAIAHLVAEGRLCAEELAVEFWGSGMDDEVLRQVGQLGLQDVVSVAPAVPYRAVAEVLDRCHGVLLLQGEAFDRQVPAKLYEYAAAGLPVWSLTGSGGETARELSRAQLEYCATTMSVTEIAEHFLRFVRQLQQHSGAVASSDFLAARSRRRSVEQFAELLDQVCAPPLAGGV